MSVPNQTPYIIYNANGLTTVFPFEFYIINAGDISVTINGEPVTSGYTVSGVGNVGGGDIIFLTPPASGAVVMLERVVPTYRLTDYQDNGDLLADTVNKDFDRLWMAIQRSFIYLGLALRRPLFGGPFNAEGYRIEKLADPVNEQDAATKKYVETVSLARTLRVPESTVQPVPSTAERANKLLAFNANGDPITVLPASGSATDVMIELAKPTGARRIGYNGATVADELDKSNEVRDVYVGSDTTSAKPTGYSGEAHYRPVIAEGTQLGNYVFESPVIVDFKSVSDSQPPSAGVMFKMGAGGLSSGDYFAQDNYHLKNITVVGGTPEFATFEPFTGLTAVIDNVRIINNGSPDKYAINFKGQNWWPTISNNIFKDYTDKKGNFCKAIDDGSDESIRRSANSRLLFTGNKVYFGGSALGGAMLTASAVFNIVRDNACEHAENAITFQYPSTFSIVDGLYLECYFGGGAQIVLGDKEKDPSVTIMKMSGIHVKNVYFNNHSQESNRFIKVGNETVVVDGLVVNNVNITNSHRKVPVIELNDVAGQSVYVGLISSGGMPLLNKTNNAVKVIDLNGSFVPSLNGNMASSGDDTGTVTNGRKKIFGNYFLSSTGTINASRYASGNQYQVNRESSFYASISLLSGTDNGFEWQNPKYSLIAGAAATVQFLAKAEHDIPVTVLIKRKRLSDAATLLAFATTVKGGDFQEFTFAFNAARSQNEEESLLSVEIRMDGVTSNNVVYVCAFRVNRGDTGLCRAANDYAVGEIDSMLSLFNFY